MFVRRSPRTGPRLAWSVSLLAALVLGGAAVPAPAAASERASYRTQALPTGALVGNGASAAGRAGSPITRIDLRPAKRFSLAALRWPDGSAPLSGRLRAQRADGSWTPWSGLEAQQSGDDGVAEGAPGALASAAEARTATVGEEGSTEPLWTGPSRRLQVELSGARPRGLRAAFVEVEGTIPRVSASAAAKRQSDALAGIRPRTDWDPDNQCKPRATAGLGSVQGVAVHHTAGDNTYSLADVPAVILAICKFHRNSNDWNDIGYNVLVDRFGGAWEGRAGGLTNAVIGAHAQGFNSVAAGISMIGDYSVIAPSPETVATVARVAAWKLAVAGVPRSGTVALTSAGGSQSRYAAGKTVVFPRVFGHRDAGLTECPGNIGYTILDGVRATVAAANPVLPAVLPSVPAPAPLPVRLSISTGKRLVAGSSATVSGTASHGSARLARATIALQVSATGDAWQTVDTTRTTSAGKYSFNRKFSRTWKVRVVRTDGDGGTSAVVPVTLVPTVTLTVPKRIRVNTKVTLRGTIAPGRGPVMLTVERRAANGTYVAGKAQPVKQSGRRLTATITPHSLALYRFQLIYAGSDMAAAAKSPLSFGRVVRASSGGGVGT